MSKQKKYDLSIALNGNNTMVVFDANAWLDMYFVPSIALREILDVIEKNKEVFWIPHQILREYERHAKKKKEERENLYVHARAKSLQKINESKDVVLQTLINLRNQCQVLDDSLKIMVEEKYKDLIQTVKVGYGTLEDSYEKEIGIIKEDALRDLVYSIYNDTKTEDFSIIEKMYICEEGALRYKYKISPGYTDDSKEITLSDSFRKYGDLIIWKEILKKVDSQPINTIFVQNEKKKDWLAEKSGTKLADVLIQEYNKATYGMGKIEVCDFKGFLECYGEVLGLQAETLESLVKRLRFENSVHDYVCDNKLDIARMQLNKYFEDDYWFYEINNQGLYGSSFGGYFESVDDTEIQNIDIISSETIYDKEICLFRIKTQFEVDAIANVEEYVNREISHVGTVSLEMEGELIQNISINYEKMEGELENSFEVMSYAVDFGHVTISNAPEFDVKWNE